jgi:hypothetical protein
MRIGGFAPNTLKKLKGDRLGLPWPSIVLAKAIGRGPTAPSKYWCSLGVEISFGSILSIWKILTKVTKPAGVEKGRPTIIVILKRLYLILLKVLP